MSNMEWHQVPLGFSTLEVSDTAVGLADATPPITGSHRAFITCTGGSVRWRPDGIAPTSTVGHILGKDDSIGFTTADFFGLLRDIRFIKITDDAILSITQFS